MVIVKLISGLGNQLFQYVIARQLAINIGEPLKIDISFFKNQNLRSYKLNNFNINAEIASEHDVRELIYKYSSKSFSSKIYRKLDRFIPKHKKTLFKEDTWWVYESQLNKISKNVYLEGYWQHYKYFENINPLILDELSLKEPLSADELALLNIILGVEDSVSIHIRRGDYITDNSANKLMGILPIQYYQDAVRHMNEKLFNPYYFVFSDDLDWAKANLRFVKNAHFIEFENGSRDFVELDLMSKCHHNIIANSSFSWWAAFLNRNQNKVVIAPKKWVVPTEINNRIELQFPSWITF